MSEQNHRNNGQHRFKIENRRKQVASLLARSLTQTEIARRLGVDQSTISDDIKVLKKMSQRFIFDLAKSDLATCYCQCLEGIDQVKKEAWAICERYESSFKGEGYRLSALRLILNAEEARFRLLSDGPNILQVKVMEQRLSEIEDEFQQANR